jgi:hypothetical protein
MWSDHGSNFVSFSRSLKESRVPVTWRFIVERGPWWGGLWERLVASVKSLLKRTVGRAALDWERLETVTTEIEAVLNRRPITFIWEGKNTGVPVPLSPQDFLLFKSRTLEACGADCDSECLRDALNEKSEWSTTLHQRWQREYLLSVLGDYGKHQKKGVKRAPVVGEVVLVLQESSKRQNWPLGKIEQLYVGCDGIVRSASVRVAGTLLNRPVQKLFPMELSFRPDEILRTNNLAKSVCAADFCCHPKDETIDWIACDSCDEWYHIRCVGLSKSEAEKQDVYNCPRCLAKTTISSL